MKIYFYIELYRAQAQSNFRVQAQAQANVCASSFELFSLAFLFVDNEKKNLFYFNEIDFNQTKFKHN